MPIVRSSAKSWYKDDTSDENKLYAPEKAYDEDYTTFYTVKDGDVDGNYLKLYLSQRYRIGTVKLTNREEGCCEQRIVDTVVMVYASDVADETKIANCGEKITGF